VPSRVRRQAPLSRYEILVDEEVVGFADYEEQGGSVVLPHTVIDPAHRGRGLAAVLVQTVLDDVRASGRRVVPECSYVAVFIERHPAYADLVADRAARGGRAPLEGHDAHQHDQR
jgi:uncharacterized protein